MYAIYLALGDAKGLDDQNGSGRATCPVVICPLQASETESSTDDGRCPRRSLEGHDRGIRRPLQATPTGPGERAKCRGALIVRPAHERRGGRTSLRGGPTSLCAAGCSRCQDSLRARIGKGNPPG